MINGEEFDHRLDALTRRFQALRDQADGLPGAREALAPALQEMAQALAAARAAHEAEVGPARSETILRHVFEAIPDLITVGDENLNVIMSNWRDHEFVTPEERQGHPKCYRVFLHRDCPCEPCVVEEVFATGQPVKKEHLSQVDGQIREIHAFPIFDKSGRATMVAKHVRNITAFKQTEKALKDSEELYRVLTERSLAGVYLIQDGIFRYINPVVAQIFGYAPEEVIGRMSPRDTTHPDDLPLVDEQIRLRLTDEIEESHYTFRGLRRDGTVIHLECLGRRIDYQGRPAIIGTLLDITERQQAEEALRDSEEKYRGLIETTSTGYVIIDPEGKVLDANQEYVRISGHHKLEEILGRSVIEWTAKRDLERNAAEVKRCFQEGSVKNLEIDYQGKNGRLIPVEINATTINTSEGVKILSLVRDITERQRLEEATAGYLQFIRLLLETIPNPIFYNDPHGMIQGCNKAFASFAGVPQEEIPGRTVYDFFPGELARICDARDREALEHPETKVLMDLQVPAADGSQRQVVCHKAAFIESSGTIGGVVSIITDITDLQQAEAALKASEERYRLLAENVTEVLWMRNMDYVHTYVSPSVKNMTGYTAEEFISLGLRQIVLPAYHKIFGTSREKLLAPDAPPSLVYEVEYRRKDNSVGWAEVTVALMRDSHGLVKGLVGMARDITLRKRAEEALRESEARYRALFETSPHGTVLMDLQLNLTMANQRGLQLFGFDSLEDVKGENGLDFIAPEDLPQSLVQMQELLETGQTGPMTVDLLRKDGTRVPSLINASLVRDAAGDPKAIIGVAQDISALKQAEAVLATHLEFMRVLMDAIPNPVFYKDAQGAYLGCNKAFSDLMRVTREEIAGKTVYDLHPKELADKFFQMDLAVFQAPGSQVYETDLQAADGIMHQVIVHKATFPGADGKVAGLVGNIVDISDLKRAEEAVRESEARLRGIFEHAPVGIIMLDARGRFLQTNPAFQAIVGYDATELGNLTCPRITHPEDLPGELRLHDELLTGKCPYYSLEKRYLRRNGEAVWVNTMQSFLRNAQGEPRTVGTIVDVTARKRAEEALRESEARLRTIFEHAPVGITLVDATGRFLQTNPAYQAIVGYSATELLGMTFQQLTHPEDLPENLRLHEELLAGQRQDYPVEKRYLRKDGEIVWVTLTLTRLEVAPGTTQLIGTIVDITARKRAEEALRESEQRFRLMAETIQDVFWIALSGNGTMKYVSPRYEQVWGRSRKELYQSAQTFLEAVHPEDRERVQSEIIAYYAQGIAWSHEYRIIKPEGEVRWIHDRGFPVKDEQGHVILFTGVAADITERKTLEQQLLLAQKMEAVGRLAGGVAHDFNNLLMTIIGYGEIMQAQVLKDDPLYDYLEDILKATDRAAALTGQLLTFSRRQVVQPQVVDLNRVVLDLNRMLRRLIEEDFELKIITAPKVGAVRADPGQLGQIIMNLVINARDAMPCGGRIIVETAEIDFDIGHQTRSGLAPPGPYAMLEVSDSGIGMDEAIQAHIFEPFFTTKEPGKGTGLGLSTVYGIVKQSGGFIDLSSEPGIGSTFTIYLPRLDTAPETPKAKVSKPMQFRGLETVLLVEDEDMLRALLAKFLRLHGYTVLEASHGGEALLICEQHQGSIHLMVTDVVMPQMSGRVLADRLTPLRPEMKVLYMSGYTEDEVIQRGVAELAVGFLQKPFKPIDLVHQIHDIFHPRARH